MDLALRPYLEKFVLTKKADDRTIAPVIRLFFKDSYISNCSCK